MKHLWYLRYIILHKWYVLLAGIHYKAPLWRLLIHDWSKFLPSEWLPYASYFYGLPRVGDRVQVDCIDGFGGPATVIDTRNEKNSRYKVRMSQGYIGEDQEFWAHDFEVRGLDTAQAAFDAAWNHHQKRQPHHWQYWLLTLDSGETHALPMPEKYVREMLADWAGAGRAITGRRDPRPWYKAKQKKMQLHPDTKRLVERLLDE